MQSPEQKPAGESSEQLKSAAEKPAAEKAAQEKSAKSSKPVKGPRVLARVNMLAKDGTRLVAGQEVHLSQAEYDRLKAEERFESKPAFSDIPAKK